MGSNAVTSVYAGESAPAAAARSPGEPSTSRASPRARVPHASGSSRCRARASRSWEEDSTPVTAAPLDAAISRASPLPQPRPSSRVPAPISTRS